MKLISKVGVLTLVCFGTIMPNTGSCNVFDSWQTNQENQGYKEISANELKSWIDSKKDFRIVDARPKKFDEGDVIIGAQFLPYDSDENTISKILPSKDDVIVAYCASVRCPASANLNKKLLALGYKHVYKYAGGIDEWHQLGYPTEKPTSKVARGGAGDRAHHVEHPAAARGAFRAGERSTDRRVENAAGNLGGYGGYGGGSNGGVYYDTNNPATTTVPSNTTNIYNQNPNQ